MEYLPGRSLGDRLEGDGGQPLGRSLLDRLGPVEPAFARDDDPLADVPEHRVGRAPEGTPGAGPARTFTLLPDQLPAQQQVEVFFEDPPALATSFRAPVGTSGRAAVGSP